MSFPSQLLRPTSGQCYAALFENPEAGVPRNVYWSFRVEFAPVPWGVDGESWDPSLAIEWVVLPFRDWRTLSGFSLSSENAPTNTEASFYVFNHSAASRFRLHIDDWRMKPADNDDTSTAVELRARIEMTADILDIDGGPDTRVEVHTECWLTFEGILVNDAAIFPKATTVTDMREALEAFVDTTHLKEPSFGEHQWAPLC